MSLLGSSLLGVLGYSPILDTIGDGFGQVVQDHKDYWGDLFDTIKDISSTSTSTAEGLSRGLSDGANVFSIWYDANRTFTTDRKRKWSPGRATARKWLSRATLSGSTIKLSNDPYQDPSWFFTIFNSPNGFSPLNYNTSTKEWCWTETYEFRNNPWSGFTDKLRPIIGDSNADSLDTLFDMSPVNVVFVALFAPIAILEATGRDIKSHYGEEINPITNLDAYRRVEIEVCLSLCDLKAANISVYNSLINQGYDPCEDEDDIQEKLNLCQ